VNAYGLDGKEIDREVDGFLSRIIQHETDHLDGVLFIDRLIDESKKMVLEELEGFESTFLMKRKAGLIGSEEQLAAERQRWESHYC
jgi:peptide deformylase